MEGSAGSVVQSALARRLSTPRWLCLVLYPGFPTAKSLRIMWSGHISACLSAS